MAAYLTPGVYRRPRATEQRKIRLVRTDVAGFAGFAERGPLPEPGKPVDPKAIAFRLTSWKEFLAIFGEFIPYGYLAYAVRAFFENGGTTCHVVRIAATHTYDELSRPRAALFALPAALREQSKTPTLLSKTDPDAFTIEIKDDAGQIAAGDMISVSSNDVTGFAMAVARNGTVLHLGRKLNAEFPAKTPFSSYEPALRITARSPGNWGNRIRLLVTPLNRGNTVSDFALRVTVDPGALRTKPVEEEFYSRLSLLDDANPYFAESRVNNFSNLIDLKVVKRPGGKAPALLVKGSPIESGPIWLEGGQDGLSDVTPQDFIGGLDDLRGLRILEEIDEVAILCAPDAVLESPAVVSKPNAPPADPCQPKPEALPPDPVADDPTAKPPAKSEREVLTIYEAMLGQCERLRDRVTILDLPAGRRTLGKVREWRDLFSSRFGALYHPWLKVPDALDLEGPTRRVPPSGHVAGIYARIDNEFGVHRPPANAALEFVTDIVDEITDLQQQDLNPFGINAIRSFQGRGIRVWGARSVAGPADADWRFIHVRRLMSMLEESVDKSTQWAVFEPNDFALRRTLVHSLSVFLEAIWQEGGLKGALPAQGFYVKCDETNNPTAIIDAGQLVCEVGIAVAAPMEFIVFEIRQMPGGAQITES